MDGGTNKSARKPQQQSGGNPSITSFFKKKVEPSVSVPESEKPVIQPAHEELQTHQEVENSPSKEDVASL